MRTSVRIYRGYAIVVAPSDKSGYDWWIFPEEEELPKTSEEMNERTDFLEGGWTPLASDARSEAESYIDEWYEPEEEPE